MALRTKIKHVDRLPSGALRFRRRFPEDVAEHLGQRTLQVHIRNREGVKFAVEYQAVMEQWESIVATARASMDPSVADKKTSQQRWHDALMTAAGLREGVVGLDPEAPETGRMILETMKTKPDPIAAKALMDPEAPAPKPTLEDAVKLYRQDNSITDGSREDVELSRIFGRLEEALGPLKDIAIDILSRDYVRTYLKHMLGLKMADWAPLSIGSSKREARIITAVVTHAIREMDIAVANAFTALHWPEEENVAMDLRNPLPDTIVSQMQIKLATARNEELRLIWSVLASTGARLGEIAGLTLDDIKLDQDIPHILIQPNAVRRLKTNSSNRSVPLSVTAQAALREALSGVEGPDPNAPVFPRYARKRGADALSAVLMKNLRTITKDKRLSVHGLRHRVSDRLREAGSPTEVRQGFLGHANQAIAERVYGGREARLREFHDWVVKAGL